MVNEKKTIDVVIGQPVQITLQSMAGSTGYSWFLSKLTGGLCLSGVSVAPGVDPSGGAIVPVNQIFEFLATEKGAFEAEFKLIAPWRPEESADTISYAVTVTEPKKTAADDIEAAMKGRDFINASAVNIGDSTNVIYAAPMSQPVLKYAAPMSQAVLKYAAPMSQPVLKYAAPMSMTTMVAYAAPVGPSMTCATDPCLSASAVDPCLTREGRMGTSTMIAYAAPVGPSTTCVTDPRLTAMAADPCLTWQGRMGASTMIAYAAPVGPSTTCATDPRLTAMAADPCLTAGATDPCLTREAQMGAATMIAYAAPVTAMDPCLAQVGQIQPLYAAPMSQPQPMYAAPLSQSVGLRTNALYGQLHPQFAASMPPVQTLYAAPFFQPRPLYAAPMIQPYAAPFTTYGC